MSLAQLGGAVSRLVYVAWSARRGTSRSIRRVRHWLGWVLLTGVNGCAGESQATPPPPAEVEFEQLEQTTYAGYIGPSPPGAVCDVASEPTVLRLDAASSVLGWHVCEASSAGVIELDEGTGVLAAADMARVRQALARIHPRAGVCAFDGSTHLLDLATASGTERMVDAVGGAACSGASSPYGERTLVEGIPELYELLMSLRVGG